MKKILSVLTAVVLCSLTFGTVTKKSCKSSEAVGNEEYTTEDIHNLQDFLLAKETPDLSGKDYDLNDDGRWDVFDMCLMRKYVADSVVSNNEIKMKLTVNGQELTATLYDNATARAFAEQLPAILPMLDLYGREMCYRFPDELPADDVQYTGYEVGEIVYWPPRHSFVIMYAQNGEQFEMQKVGRIDSGVEIFSETGDVDVTFESD